MFDNINIFYKDAEFHITEVTARKVIRLLKKRIADGVPVKIMQKI